MKADPAVIPRIILICIISSFFPGKQNEHLSFMDMLNEGLQVIDSTAASMCMDNNVELLVFNMNESGNILRAIKGEKIGTVISREE